MEKKNIVYILLDAFTYTYLQEKEYKSDNMPFVHSLKEHSYTFENMYSQAPFTEAAFKSTIQGQSPLENKGYIRGNVFDKDSIISKYKKKGYQTYVLTDPMVNPGKACDIDQIMYGRPYRIDNFLNHRLKYFFELYDGGKMTDKDFKDLLKMWDDNFTTWLSCLEAIKHDEFSVRLFQNKYNKKVISSVINTLNTEFEIYSKNKLQYIEQVLKEKQNHKIFRIKSFYFSEDSIDNYTFEGNFRKKYKYIFRKINYLNLIYNIKNNTTLKLSLKKLKFMKKLPIKYKLTETIKHYISNFYNKNIKFYYSKHTEYSRFLCFPSARKQFDVFFEWLDDSYVSDKPFFSFFHLDDIHYCSMFYSYDYFDENIRDRELNVCQEYLNGVKKGYKGNLTYDLAIRHVDNRIKEFCNKLYDRDLLEDTIIILTSDHGYMLANSPIREGSMLNFYDELYHVPCIIYNPKFIGKQIQKFYNTKDISLILDSILESKPLPQERNLVMAEFMGNGCPDIQRRPIYLSARNFRWSISCWFYLKNQKVNFYELYDLVNDPLEQYNLINKNIHEKTLDEVIEMLFERKLELENLYI